MKNCKCQDVKEPEKRIKQNAVNTLRELKEHKLIEKAKQGEQSALLALYEQYMPLFKNYAVTGLIILMFWKLMI